MILPIEETDFVNITWHSIKVPLGSGFRHEENLRDKRCEIISEIYNDNSLASGKFSQSFFNSLFNFKIDYLRVHLLTPYRKKFNFIDGRCDAKE